MWPRGSIATRVLGTLEEIEAIAAAWRGLETDCADPLGYFQSYDWCRNWVARFGRDGAYRPYIVTLWCDENLIAIWPRMIVEIAGIKRLETLGMPHSQYCGVLVRRDAAPMAKIARQLRAAVQASKCDVTISRAVPEGSALAEILADKPVVTGSDNLASLLDLSGFASAEAYTAQLGKLQKRNRNRRRNHLARLGELSFEVIWPDHPEFEALVRQCTEMKRRWLTETGRFSTGFSMGGYEDFLALLAGDSVRHSGACLSVLRVGDRVAAIELGLLHQKHYYAYIGGFDWDLRDLSPGKVQMDLTVGWLIDHGIAAYDLLINQADYKTSWTNRSIAVTSRAEALSWRGRFYASAWLPRLRPALKRLHGRLPKTVEQATNFLRPAVCLLLYV
ncbi:GNAT family N-acetyltransferase [Devosia sp. YIM 151766]|uniref:GNAT family N-acetyltransferase n=1 Tax=Devosia sp. YIM 151766 TaxID=3017325 RepID=UPI00255D0942|nr:GNAT family N-acetyltransferase [Devosia sp. YIM 151766]WIY54504.1 GNAT family N-acetyltransferase [Devosia sp. YIM 151766]